MKSFLIGLGTGIGLGLLVAPASGSESRRELRRAAEDFAERAPQALRNAADEVIERAPQLIREMAERLPDVREVAQHLPHIGGNGSAERLNGATREELLAVYGVGPVLADRIMAGRPYDSADDLVKRGIVNPQLLENLKRELLDRIA